MAEFVDRLLGDVVTLKRGYDLPTRSRTPGEVPVVSSSGMTGFNGSAKAEPPGVVTGRYGTLGKVFYMNRPFWPLNTTLYVTNFHGNNPRFVAYFLESMGLARYNGAAAVPGLDRNVLHRLPIRWPDTDTQTRVVSVLAAYDELIQNNMRRVDLLEEMASTLYREWFVDFRLPGIEGLGLADSVLGPIPDGWSVSSIGEQSVVVMGQSPRSEFYNTRRQGLPFHQGVTDFGTHAPSHRKFCTVQPRVAEPGDTLVSVRAPVGRVNVADTRLVIGRGLAAIRSARGTPGFHYRQLRWIFRFEDTMGGGTIYRAITRADLAAVPWLLPSPEAARKFEEVERPMFSLLLNLTHQNQALVAARDLLLRRLVTGTLDVSEVEIDVEWLAS